MKAKLIRIEESEQGTVGVLRLNDKAFCCTLEPSDEDNQVNISCIPIGTYTVKRVQSPKYGDTFEITNVPNRTHILFHAGNVEKHTKGCVLLGQYFGKLQGKRAVLNSGNTFKRFKTLLSDIDEFTLEIIEVK